MNGLDRYSESDIVICRPGHEGLGKVWGESGGWEQSDGGPLIVVVGSETSDEKCQQLAERFDLHAPGLIWYRDSKDRFSDWFFRCRR